MNRFRLAIGFIIIILCAIFLVGAASIFWPRATDPASIALSDPSVRGSAFYVGEVKVGNVTSLGEDRTAGYFHATDTLKRVPIQKGSLETLERYIVYVDLNQSKVVGVEWYSRFNMPASMDIKIQPGDSWYYLLDAPVNTNDGTQVFSYSLCELSPENATVIPTIVDEANLFRMKNGSPYEAAEYIDTFTHQPALMNGTTPIYPGWEMSVSVQRSAQEHADYSPAFDTSHLYYLVLKNDGMDEAKMVLGSP